MKRTVWFLFYVLLMANGVVSAGDIVISGPGLTIAFQTNNDRLALLQVRRDGGDPLMYADQETRQPGPGPIGNPLSVVVREGKNQGVYGIGSFRITKIQNSERRILVYLQHDAMPLLMGIEVSVEGNVATWTGQACWNGDEAIELDIYYPLLSRLRFDNPKSDRLLTAQTSGSVRAPLGEINYANAYLGNLSCPVFLVEGGERGLAWVDDNRADYGPDASATCLRGQVVGNTFPISAQPYQSSSVKGGDKGPFAGVRHTRRFRGIGEAGIASSSDDGVAASGRGASDRLPMKKMGDALDLGPIRMYAYAGSWKTGALWLREQRQHLAFRVSPARWYQNTTFIAEDMGDSMVRRGQSFYDYPKVLAEKQQMGADLFHLPGFHDPEILGTSVNWNNRGDYFFAAQNLGGFEAARHGINTVHRQNGHVLYYVEGLIMWKRSRIGVESGKQWALMEPDGQFTEHYKGFWHMCPAVKEWQDWLAHDCAEMVRTTGVDGFFIDSALATYNHRCYNPAHRHPHPDVWNWGIRQMLKRVREEVDKVNPETIIVVEGCGDMGREFADGFVAHGHFWTQDTFREPFVRFLHPDMRAYESWGYGKDPRPAHIWNSVNGYRVYAHNASVEQMRPLSLRTRRYYDAFPEICDSPMSAADLKCAGALCQQFDSAPVIVTIGNPTDQDATAVLELSAGAGMLFDRVDSMRVPVIQGKASVSLKPFEFRAFEVRR